MRQILPGTFPQSAYDCVAKVDAHNHIGVSENQSEQKVTALYLGQFKERAMF